MWILLKKKDIINAGDQLGFVDMDLDWYTISNRHLKGYIGQPVEHDIVRRRVPVDVVERLRTNGFTCG